MDNNYKLADVNAYVYSLRSFDLGTFKNARFIKDFEKELIDICNKNDPLKMMSGVNFNAKNLMVFAKDKDTFDEFKVNLRASILEFVSSFSSLKKSTLLRGGIDYKKEMNFGKKPQYSISGFSDFLINTLDGIKNKPNKKAARKHLSNVLENFVETNIFSAKKKSLINPEILFESLETLLDSEWDFATNFEDLIGVENLGMLRNCFDGSSKCSFFANAYGENSNVTFEELNKLSLLLAKVNVKKKTDPKDLESEIKKSINFMSIDLHQNINPEINPDSLAKILWNSKVLWTMFSSDSSKLNLSLILAHGASNKYTQEVKAANVTKFNTEKFKFSFSEKEIDIAILDVKRETYDLLNLFDNCYWSNNDYKSYLLKEIENLEGNNLEKVESKAKENTKLFFTENKMVRINMENFPFMNGFSSSQEDPLNKKYMDINKGSLSVDEKKEIKKTISEKLNNINNYKLFLNNVVSLISSSFVDESFLEIDFWAMRKNGTVVDEGKPSDALVVYISPAYSDSYSIKHIISGVNKAYQSLEPILNSGTMCSNSQILQSLKDLNIFNLVIDKIEKGKLNNELGEYLNNFDIKGEPEVKSIDNESALSLGFKL